VKVRIATIKDSKSLVELYQTLDQESSFMLLEPGERDASVENQEKQMVNFSNSTSQSLFVAENEANEIVGFVVGVGGKFSRNKHSLYCVIGVINAFQGKGIGKSLLTRLEIWANNLNFKRLELTVMQHNTNAIRLYESFGFEHEGIKRNSIKISGKLINELYMSKLLNA
jgi:RimJ/RimL family protein N-acetyltransferase